MTNRQSSSWGSRIGRLFMGGMVKAFGQDTVAGMLFPSWRTGPRLGSEGMLRAYSAMPWLRGVEQKISQDVAATSWQVLVPVGSRKDRWNQPVAIRDMALQRSGRHEDRAARLQRYAKDDKLREIPNHPLIEFLGSGTPWFSSQTALALTQTHLDLVGEMAWLLDVNAYDIPTSFVPIPPTWIQALPRDNGGMYRVTGPGATYEVPDSRMLFAYHPDPASPFRRGSGLAMVLADELETDEYAAKYTKDWFRNRAIPPVLIAGLGQHIDELKRLEEKWLSKYQRSGAGWLPHFLNAKVDVHQLSQTFEQQQLGSLRKNERDIVFQVYGMPPEQMGVLENSNRSTIDASDYIYSRRLIMPRDEFLRGVIQDKLAPRYDERLVVHYVSPVKEDLEFALKVRTATPWAWMQDEWREFGGSEPLPAGRGKVFMVPVNLVPMDTLEPPPDIVTPPEPPPALPAPGGPPGGEPPNELPSSPSGNRRLLGSGQRLRLHDGQRFIDAEVVGEDGQPVRAVVRADDPKIRAAKAAVRWQVIERHGKPILRATVGKFGQDAITDVGFETDFNLRDPLVEEHLRDWGADRLADTVNETTKKKVGNALADGIAAGETNDELVDRIRAVFDVRIGQAEAIAATETTRSSNFAWVQGMRQAGLEQKEWLSTEDSHVRDGPDASHVALDGQIVGLDENFIDPVSKAEGPYPGGFGIAAEDVNCRCGVITVMAQRSMLTAEQRSAIWKTLESERAPYTRRMAAALAAAFKEQARAVIATLGGGSEASVETAAELVERVTDRVAESLARVQAPAIHLQVPDRIERVVTVRTPLRRRTVERDEGGRAIAIVDQDEE